MLTTCPERDGACSCVHVASVAAAAGNAPPDPARAVTPSGTPRCKNAGRRAHPSPRTTHNNPAERTFAGKVFRRPTLGADPRALPSRQRPPPPPAAAPAVVADNSDAARAAAHARSPWPDTPGSPSRTASAAPPPHSPLCNSDSADAAAQTTAHSPSANSDVLDMPAAPLVPAQRRDEMTLDPRELLSLTVKSRSQVGAWLRGASDLWQPPRITL
jgi:hypothetical protein